MPALIPLVTLLTSAFVIGLLNVALTGQLSVNQPWNIIQKLVLISIIYWWYHTDKNQHQYRAGVFLNAGVVALSLIAVPVYLFRSRGAKQGAKAFAFFIAFLAALIASLVLGGAVAKHFTS